MCAISRAAAPIQPSPPHSRDAALRPTHFSHWLRNEKSLFCCRLTAYRSFGRFVLCCRLRSGPAAMCFRRAHRERSPVIGERPQAPAELSSIENHEYAGVIAIRIRGNASSHCGYLSIIAERRAESACRHRQMDETQWTVHLRLYKGARRFSSTSRRL